MRKRWRSCLALVLGLVSLFVCWLLFGVSFNLSGQSPLQKLESARKVWDQQGIDDYQMTVTFGSFSYLGWFHFTIRDNQITQISTVRNVLTTPTETPASAKDADISGYAKSFGSYGSFPASLNDYTMDNLFDFAAQKLASEPTMPLVSWCGITEEMRPQATFDEQYGYINFFSYRDTGRWNVGGGLLCYSCNTLECNSSVRILNFEPLK